MTATLLERLHASRDETRTKAEAILAKVEAREAPAIAAELEARKLTDETQRTEALAKIERGFVGGEQAEFDQLVADCEDFNSQIAQRSVLAVARDDAASHSPAVVRSEPLTYNRQNAYELDGKAQPTSWFRDLFHMQQGDPDAAARLQRHAKEMDVRLVERAQRRGDNAEREVRNVVGYDIPSPFEKRVNPNRTDGQGGYLVPPDWLMDALIPVLRAGRVVADQVRKMDLPEGTDSINIPKLATGTTAAIQTADAAGVSSTDFTDTSVSAGVKTIAGQQDVAIQLIDQSPLNLDEILFTDLIADYNKKLDVQVLAGSNASGQIQGLYSSAGASSWTNYNQVSYTDASPTAGELNTQCAAALSQIEQNRFDLDGVKFFMHSRRWFWMIGSTDTAGRPLVLPKGTAHFNSIAEAGPATGPPGYKGELGLGFSAYTDPNITTTDTAGSGTLQDIILALKTDDAWLFEGELRQRTLPEILSGTLQVRFQIYNYVAFLLRYAQSLAIISGTGLSAPSGF